MSRPYRFYIQVNEDLGEKVFQQLEEALGEECFDDITWNVERTVMDHGAKRREAGCFEAYGEYSLSRISEDEEVSRLRELVWSFAGRYVEVGVSATYLPGTHYRSSKDDFEKWEKFGGRVFKRCRICGGAVNPADEKYKETENEDVCWNCEGEWPTCDGCGQVFERRDPDDTHCDGCKIDEAEHRMEER